jgi:hypothetical protein
MLKLCTAIVAILDCFWHKKHTSCRGPSKWYMSKIFLEYSYLKLLNHLTVNLFRICFGWSFWKLFFLRIFFGIEPKLYINNHRMVSCKILIFCVDIKTNIATSTVPPPLVYHLDGPLQDVKHTHICIYYLVNYPVSNVLIHI